MDDLGRYYMHGENQIRRVASVVMYVAGAMPDLRRHQDQTRQRIAGEIEGLLGQMEAKLNRGSIPAIPTKMRDRCLLFADKTSSSKRRSLAQFPHSA